MKRTYNAPKLSIHGSVAQLTEQNKTVGNDDGVILTIPGITPDGGVPIGS